MTSTINLGHLGAINYSTKRTDEKDYKTEYVSYIEFRNSGKTIFGNTPWWQGIDLSYPESLDELIWALSYIRALNSDPFTIDKEDSGLVSAIRRCNNMCKAERVEDGWSCEWCGEVTASKYADEGKPKRCSGCGAYFNEYVDKGE